MTLSTTQALTDVGRRALIGTMVLIRTYEEAIRAVYYADKKPAFDIGAGLVPGEMHLSAGQEPVAAGICAHLTPEDALTATHPAAPPGHRAWRCAAPDDGRDLRS